MPKQSLATKETPTDRKAPGAESSLEKINGQSIDSSKQVYNEREKKWQSFITRTVWALIMLVFFLTCLVSGNLPLILMIAMFQIMIFREIIAMISEPARDKKLKWNKSLNWYFLVCTVYYVDFQSFFEFFEDSILQYRVLSILASNHRFISYGLYVAGFVFFVSTLQKGYYKFQFAQLCITHTTLLLVVFQSHLIIDNMLNGLFWFLLPAGLVIVNDVFAYICGITFGKTQLIAISPKKTVEGFVGAWACTSIAAVIFAHVMSNSYYLICPAVNLHTTVYNYPICEPNPVFIAQFYQIPPDLVDWVGTEILSLKPVYFHAIALASFASLIAPFGGFFASGLKRAFGIKDFGDTIPGHGGITDRMDCQFLMGSFSYLYYQTFISTNTMSIGKILQLAILNLNVTEISLLIKSLLKYINNAGVLTDEKYKAIIELLEG